MSILNGHNKVTKRREFIVVITIIAFSSYKVAGFVNCSYCGPAVILRIKNIL